MIASGGSVVLVDHAVEASSASDRGVHRDDGGRVMVGRQLLAALMGTVLIEVVEVLADRGLDVAFVVDQDVVEALFAEAAAEALDVAVREGCPRRRTWYPGRGSETGTGRSGRRGRRRCCGRPGWSTLGSDAR